MYLYLYLISFSTDKQTNIFNTQPNTQDKSLVVSCFGLRNLLSTI